MFTFARIIAFLTFLGLGQNSLGGGLRQRLHGTGSIWNRYEIGKDKPCVYTGPGGSGTDRICYLVPNGSTYKGDPIWNRTVPVVQGPVQTEWIRTTVDPIPNGSEHI